MKDSWKKSWSEVALGIIVGFPINYLGNLVILPYYNVAENPYWYSFEIGVWFTIISVLRTIGFRRLFNHFGENENLYTLSKRLALYTKSRLWSIRINTAHVR